MCGLSVFPREHLRHLVLLAPEASHPRWFRLVVRVAGTDRSVKDGDSAAFDGRDIPKYGPAAAKTCPRQWYGDQPTEVDASCQSNRARAERESRGSKCARSTIFRIRNAMATGRVVRLGEGDG